MSKLKPITREEKYPGHMTGLCDSMSEPLKKGNDFFCSK